MSPDAPWIKSISTGAVIPPACRAWRCDHCGPRRAVRTGAAIDAAGYSRWVTLTNAPADARQGAARAANRFRRRVGGWEWIWTLERGQKTGMVHLHGMVRAPYIPQADLSVLAKEAGWGENTWIEAGVNTAGGYSAKCAGYAAKGYADYGSWRALNGTRPWHWSRSYTAGVPMREWLRENAPAADPGPWRLVNARDLPSYAANVERWKKRGERYASEWIADGGPARCAALVEQSKGVAALRSELGAWDYDSAAIGHRW